MFMNEDGMITVIGAVWSVVREMLGLWEGYEVESVFGFCSGLGLA